MIDIVQRIPSLAGAAAVIAVAGCAGRSSTHATPTAAPQPRTPGPAATQPGSSASNVALTGRVLPVDRQHVAEYGVPQLIGEVGLNGIVTYLRPHSGLWPKSADTAHVYYYLDQKKTLYFAPGQAVRTQPLSDDQAAFMKALAEGPRPVNR